MSAESQSANFHRERKELHRVMKSNADFLSVPLMIGGEVKTSFIEDVREHIGPIENGHGYTVKERRSYFVIEIYHDQPLCSVTDCPSVGNHKFDGNWLCDKHLNSYTEKHF